MAYSEFFSKFYTKQLHPYFLYQRALFSLWGTKSDFRNHPRLLSTFLLYSGISQAPSINKAMVFLLPGVYVGPGIQKFCLQS